MKNKALLFGLLCSLLIVLPSCSMFGKGKKAGEGAENGLSETDLNAQRENRFGAGSIPTAEGEGLFHDVHFDFNSADIGDAGRQEIEYNVEVLKQHPDIKVQLEGHCDERGTAQYNMALGSTRARNVYDVLASYGIPRNRLDTISYGEEVPLDSGHSEEAWSKNRRVHFSAFTNKGQR